MTTKHLNPLMLLLTLMICDLGNLLDYLWATHKTGNTERENGMHGMQGTRLMFTKIPGNLVEDSEECCHFNIPENV